MKLPHSVPCPNGTDRAHRAREVRDIASQIAYQMPHALTHANGEELDYAGARFPSNFTKGLAHDEFGIVEDGAHYAAFVEAVNSDNNNLFSSGMFAAQDHPLHGGGTLFRCEIPKKEKQVRQRCGCALEPAKPKETTGKPEWRGWESPRAGHVYDLEGPDAACLAMAPAPRIVSSEIAAEMTEVYALALLRDIPFSDICAGKSKKKICDKRKETGLISGADAAAFLNATRFYSGKATISSSIRTCSQLCEDDGLKCEERIAPPGATPDEAGSRLDRFERNRRYARTQDPARPFTAQVTAETVFRGSTPGALRGPYISQFMLIGSPSLANGEDCRGNFSQPSKFGIEEGYIRYGTQVIDQRVVVHKECLDHLTDWSSWLDVQNGANMKGLDRYDCERRFVTTPRDLATFVHFDALYQAYLNAVLIIDSLGTPTSKGFPEPSFTSGELASGAMVTPRRTGFATFGGPHILSLVTEVASRCLKAVRRQKFNYHRRARPEAMGGRLTLVACGEGKKLGCAEDDFERLLCNIPEKLRTAIAIHNAEQNSDAMRRMRGIKCPPGPRWLKEKCNLLLPMAFPEGSPMHPAYGAGHATVAGGCVTMVKAFFEMFEDCDGAAERPLCFEGEPICYEPDTSADNEKLRACGKKGDKPLTIQGELDKLAANIAIGRNMAGVHYYSDYYDSLRMGERMAVGILLEQAPTYGDPIETSFTSFDGDRITISGQGDSAGMLTIIDRGGNPVSPRDWWLRHNIGEEIVLAV